MALRYRNPRNPVFQLRDEMDRLLGGVFGPWADGGLPLTGRGQPSLNMWETSEAVLVELEVPGLKGDQVDISVVGRQMTLKVDRPELHQDGVTYHRRERPAGSFTRVVELPVDVDADRVEARLRDGVLTITLPKAPSAIPRRIEVNAAG